VVLEANLLFLYDIGRPSINNWRCGWLHQRVATAAAVPRGQETKKILQW